MGHDEYYSAAERGQLERYTDSGGSIAFFSGNLATWQTRHESDPLSDSGEGSREAEGYRFVTDATTAKDIEGHSFMICYKQYVFDAVCVAYTCRRLIDAVCFVYTCRRLIEISLIAGTTSASLLGS